VAREIILIVVAVFITVVVYGLVALIIKMDDIGLSMVERDSAAAQKVGRGLVTGMPKVLTWLSIVGTGPTHLCTTPSVPCKTSQTSVVC
jgi:uncharacterized protein